MVNNIIYSNFQSPLGDMIAGATDMGICFLEWHDRGGVERILKRVEKRYKKPLMKGSTELLRKFQIELHNYFGNTIDNFTTPIDVNGTKFENGVWRKLLEIPYLQ